MHDVRNHSDFNRIQAFTFPTVFREVGSLLRNDPPLHTTLKRPIKISNWFQFILLFMGTYSKSMFTSLISLKAYMIFHFAQNEVSAILVYGQSPYIVYMARLTWNLFRLKSCVSCFDRNETHLSNINTFKHICINIMGWILNLNLTRARNENSCKYKHFITDMRFYFNWISCCLSCL